MNKMPAAKTLGNSAPARSSNNFGTGVVFYTSISTVLGAILFLRFGYAVAHVSFMGVLAIILLGHAVTIPTAMAVAEIATNHRVEGGGIYFIISRSFGLTVGGAIGIALFLSQAISAAFYMIAFAESLDPLLNFLNQTYGWPIWDKRFFSIPSMILLIVVMLYKGADMGVKLLYSVIVVLFLSLLLFFLGAGPTAGDGVSFETLTRTIENPDRFFYVFSICFPAFTGMAAGVGLSGDLKDPKRAIPRGTLAATWTGMIIYAFVAYKLAVSASPQSLDEDQLVMSQVALWGPIIPIGLACAAISSALGSVLVAPRTLQAIGGDQLFPSAALNDWLARGTGDDNEPVNGSLVAGALALVFVGIGDVNIVAEIISMFFMVTYGSICLISFLEHFSSDPSYRPTFVSRWYISLFGALACVWLMLQMNFGYALASIMIMGGIYWMISYYNPEKKGLSAIVQGVIFQVSRQLQIFLQGAYHSRGEINWRPSVVCISRDSFQRQSAFEIVRWIGHRHGFGTYIHFLEGYLSKASSEEAQQCKARLIRMAGASKGRVFVDTLVSPSATTAICQAIQLPGISGHDNNGFLFEFSKKESGGLKEIAPNVPLVISAKFDVYILGSSIRKFGYHKEIHIWLTRRDYANASLMVMISYILLGHPDWRNGTVRIFATYPETLRAQEEERLRKLIKAGRLPISQNNIQFIATGETQDLKSKVNRFSCEADLVILGFRPEMLKRHGEVIFTGYDQVGDILFVNTSSEKEIASVEEISEVADSPDLLLNKGSGTKS